MGSEKRLHRPFAAEYKAEVVALSLSGGKSIGPKPELMGAWAVNMLESP